MSKTFAKKSLGQNFLQSTTIRQQIIDLAGDIRGQNILEIGPGLGFLTTKLLKVGANLTAVELDPRACEFLKRDFGHMDTFRLVEGSILDIDLDKIFDQEQNRYSVIANIPYHITAPIIRKLLAETKNKPEYAILMVQKEVAHKITNPDKRSILSISVEVFAKAEYGFTVGREEFQPVPRVDSAIIKITTRPTPLVEPKDLKDFFTVVNAGFNEKRKKIGNHIGKFFGVSAKTLLGNIDPNLRAENLGIDDWITIMHNFQTIK